jgi:hypothetical protein
VNLDQMAREAAQDAKEAARAMPIVPVEKLRGRRIARLAAPVLGLAAVIWVVVVSVIPPSGDILVIDPVAPSSTIETTPTTIAPDPSTLPEAPATIDAQWVRGGANQIRDDEGVVLYEYPLTILYGRNTAWDGGEGFVALTGSGLIWLRPSGQDTVNAPFGSIVDVSISERGTHIVGIDPFDGEVVVWVELETGDETTRPNESKTLDGVTFTVGDRMATIEAPDWSDAEVDEIGRPLPPFDLPTLVVTEGGEEVLRLEVGGDQLPHVNIHDFDGRRLILGAEPFEPAVPPVTAWIVDLECAGCTQRVDTETLEYFDLIGVLPSGGPVVTPDLP